MVVVVVVVEEEEMDWQQQQQQQQRNTAIASIAACMMALAADRLDRHADRPPPTPPTTGHPTPTAALDHRPIGDRPAYILVISKPKTPPAPSCIYINTYTPHHVGIPHPHPHHHKE